MPSPVGYSESIHYGDEATYYVDWLTNEDSFPSLGQTSTNVANEWEKIDYLKEQQTKQYVDVAVHAQDVLADVNELYPFPSIHPQRERMLSNKKKNKKEQTDSDTSDNDDDYKYDAIDNDIDPYYAIYQLHKSASGHSHYGTQRYMKHIRELIRVYLSDLSYQLDNAINVDEIELFTLREIHQLINNSQKYLPYKAPSERLRPNICKQNPLKHSLEEDFTVSSIKLKNKKKLT